MDGIKLKNFKIKVNGKKYQVIESFNALGSLNSLQFDIYRKGKFFTKAFGTQPNRKEAVKAAIEKELQTIENTRLTGIDIQEVQPIFGKITEMFSKRGKIDHIDKVVRNETLYIYEDLDVRSVKKGKNRLLTITVIYPDEPKKGK